MSAESKPLPIIEVINLRKKYGLIQALKGNKLFDWQR